MPFEFYTNMLSRASRTLASSILIVGLLLIGFGTLILAFPPVFAFLAAMVFFIAGLGCALTAIKILWAQWHLDRYASHEDQNARRINVRIHHGDRYGL